MSRLLRLFFFLGFCAAIGIFALWYIRTPQPLRHDVQIAYFRDSIIYEYHKTLAKEKTEDTAFLTTLAQQGNIPARIKTSELLFLKGKENPASYKEAVDILKVLAEEGVPFGQNALGVALNNGLGLDKDKIEAFKWFKLAGETGYMLPRDNLMKLGLTLTQEEISQGSKRAEEWRENYLKAPFSLTER
ncbi:MAG: putative hemagglutinin protein [Alphaproteobacteria bacterium]|nr:putative hemagglutinin protein [Alphaproteobacteria bacterium]